MFMTAVNSECKQSYNVRPKVLISFKVLKAADFEINQERLSISAETRK